MWQLTGMVSARTSQYSYCIFLYLRVQLKEFYHDNIQPFVGACVEPENICYLMQWCNRGTLQVGETAKNCVAHVSS